MKSQKENEPNLGAILSEFTKLGEKFNTLDGWWNYVDQEVLDYDSYRYSAMATGLIFKAAKEGKTLYELESTAFQFKSPVDKNVDELIKELSSLPGIPVLLEKRPSIFSDIIKKNVLLSGDNGVGLLSVTRTLTKQPSLLLKIISPDKNIIDKANEAFKKYAEQESETADLFILSEDDDGKLIFQTIGKPGQPLNHGNYSEEVIKDYKFFMDELAKSEPFGRLVIIRGNPGTGKTYLLKSVVNELKLKKVKFVFLQPDILSRLRTSALLKLFIEKCSDDEKLVLLIEDGDELLIKRESDNLVALANLLNLADGFIGNLLDIRVIVTTNAKKFDLDPALQRPGRLCKIIDVESLPQDKAETLYYKLTNEHKTFSKPMILADIFALANNNVDLVKSEPIGFK